MPSSDGAKLADRINEKQARTAVDMINLSVVTAIQGYLGHHCIAIGSLGILSLDSFVTAHSVWEELKAAWVEGGGG